MKKSVFAFLTLCLTIGFFELFLRVLDPIGIEYFVEVSKYFNAMRPNDKYAYIHDAGYRARLQGVDILINSHGLRGPEFQKEKPITKKRVLILGDSVVFGWGAPQKDIFALQLQELIFRHPLEIEVIPAGVGSWNTRTEFEYLRNTAKNFYPDVLVLLIAGNDLEPKRNGHTAVSKDLLFKEEENEKPTVGKLPEIWRKTVSRSYLLQYIQYFWKIQKAKQSQKQIEEDSPEWKDARLGLDGIIELCHKNGIDFVAYLYSSKSRIMGNTALNLYKNYLESIGERVFLLPDLLFTQTQYRNSFVDGHPNASGHTIIAEEMFKVLLPELTKKEKGYSLEQ